MRVEDLYVRNEVHTSRLHWPAALPWPKDPDPDLDVN
jgi:hypothetical protein